MVYRIDRYDDIDEIIIKEKTQEKRRIKINIIFLNNYPTSYQIYTYTLKCNTPRYKQFFKISFGVYPKIELSLRVMY